MRLITVVLIFAFGWTTTVAGQAPGPSGGKSANEEKAQALTSTDKDKAKEDEMKPMAMAGKSAKESGAKKKFPWLIVAGAVVVVGGAVAIWLLTKKEKPGSIAVASNPAEAKVYLDEADTGKITPCTLDNVPAGNHTVKLMKEGYRDFEQSVTVRGKQTANVNANLIPNVITVTSPSSGASWQRGSAYDIAWTTDASLSFQARTSRESAGFSAPERSSFPAELTSLARNLAITSVNIDLYKAGAKVLTIASDSANDATERWTVPAGQAIGSDYKIRILCSAEASIYGESGSFAITSQYGDIAITSEPDHANVTLDGVATGLRTNCTIANVTPGTHSLRLDLEIYGKWQGNIQVYTGQTTNVNVYLIPYTYELVTKWGSLGSANGQFNNPQYVALNSSNEVYVTDQGNYRIQKFTSDGTYLWNWRQFWDYTDYFKATGVGVDGANTVYAGDSWHDFIVTFGGGSGYIGSGQLETPEGIAGTAANEIYVADLDIRKIFKYSSTGTLLATWDNRGSGNGPFGGPYGVAVDSSENVYICDGNYVWKFSSNGSHLLHWGGQGSGNGQFNLPMGVACHSSGVVYVTDYFNHRIQKFTDVGTYITQWGSQGSGDGQFNNPKGIAVDSSENVYVVDKGNNRIQKFRMNTSAPSSAQISYTRKLD